MLAEPVLDSGSDPRKMCGLPWLGDPFGLWSLRDLLRSIPPRFITMMGSFKNTQQVFANLDPDVVLPTETMAHMKQNWLGTADLNAKYGFEGVNGQIQRFCKLLDGKITTRELAIRLDELNGRMDDIFEDHVWLQLDPSTSRYYTLAPADIFSEGVCEKFPGSLGELDEAMKCFSLDRPTACVFHLMRVLETVCGSVWASLGVPIALAGDNWGDYKRAISDYLEGRLNPPPTYPRDWK